jgi:hypothetical protein
VPRLNDFEACSEAEFHAALCSMLVMPWGRQVIGYLVHTYLLAHPPLEPEQCLRWVGRQDLVRELLDAIDEARVPRQTREEEDTQ